MKYNWKLTEFERDLVLQNVSVFLLLESAQRYLAVTFTLLGNTV